MTIGTEHTVNSGSRSVQVFFYEPAEVESILNAVAGADEYVGNYPCPALADPVDVLRITGAALEANYMPEQFVSELNTTIPERCIGGAWLFATQAAQFTQAVQAWRAAFAECDAQYQQADEPEPAQMDPLVVAGVAAEGTGGAVALGLLGAAGLVFGVWLLFKGKR
ncbi:MAG: hypothetical protein M0R22_00540 [Dehalococcoidia bacterium]|jgi:hypothetical protein|nr:hypothetical protein [Dehalococcoidia bacterium]